MTIDVSELLLDPDFTQSVQVIRATAPVDIHGRVTPVETTFEIVASVQANSGQALAMLVDGSRISDSISVHSQTLLFASEQGRVADIVVWRNRRYVVKIVRLWDGWGAGFCSATCEYVGVNF